METADLQHIVDAAANELGIAAGADAVRDLSERSLEHLSDAFRVEGALGVEVLLTVHPPSGAGWSEAITHAEERFARTVSGLPAGIPALVHLPSFAAMAEGLTGRHLVELARALDRVATGAGLPAVRLAWADLGRPGLSDLRVLEHLGAIAATSRLLCGHLRCADPSSSLDTERVAAVVTRFAQTQRHTPLGLAVNLAEPKVMSGVIVHPVGPFADPPHRVAANGWARKLATRGASKSGLTWSAGAPRDYFDVPPEGLTPVPVESLERLHAAGAPAIVWT